MAITDAEAYYHGPYENGAAYRVLRDGPVSHLRFAPIVRVAAVFPQVTYAYACRHRPALAAYARLYELVVNDAGLDELIIVDGEGNTLAAQFAPLGRLANLSGAFIQTAPAMG